jgi:hypothetical protein
LAALLSILSSLLVGVVLVVAPWTTLWESNWLLTLWPGARGPALSAFTRGAVTGLGLVNLVLAARDLYARLTGVGVGGE